MKSKFSDHTSVFLYDFYYCKPFIKETRRKNLNKEREKKKKLKGKRKSMHGCKVISIVLGFDINLVTYS
jgi:hypothetical protein